MADAIPVHSEPNEPTKRKVKVESTVDHNGVPLPIREASDNVGDLTQFLGNCAVVTEEETRVDLPQGGQYVHKFTRVCH